MKDNKNLDDSFLKENEYIFKKYKPIKKIGKGTFGNIYSTIRLKDKNVFAIKTEKINANYKTLKSEAIYLFTLQGFGIPKYITYGHTKKYNILIETLLDKSLFFIYIKRRILCDITDACFIGMQLLDRLEWIHSKDIIYRDVKPENFLIGINDPNVIYVVDFGLCKKYRSSKTGKHILPKYTKKFNGTLRYASFNVVKGKESSRRDDLISLGYMLIYLIKRDLPWEADFKNLNKERYFNLLLSKDNDGFGRLFKNIPPEIIEFVKYSKNLKFEQDPDYSYLRSLFNKLFLSKNIDYKKLTFSFIHSKDKKLLGIPRNNSTRKESPQYRILKTIKKERSKRQITSSLSNLKNDSQSYSPVSTNENKIILYSNNMNSSKFTHSEKVLRNDNNSNNNINVFYTINSKNKEFGKPTSKYHLKKRNKLSINTSNNYTLNSMNNNNDSYSYNISKSNFIADKKENKKKTLYSNREEKAFNAFQIKRILQNSHSLNITPNISYKSSFRNFNKNNNINKNKNIKINNNNQILSNIGCKSLLFNSNMIYKSPLLKNNYSAKNNNGTKIKFNEPIKNVKKFPINQINLTSYKIPKSLEMNRVSINSNKNFKPFARDINDINFVFINNNIKISPKQNKKIQLNHCKTLKEIKNRFINNNFQTYNNY